jgi:hypothetical protein
MAGIGHVVIITIYYVATNIVAKEEMSDKYHLTNDFDCN